MPWKCCDCGNEFDEPSYKDSYVFSSELGNLYDATSICPRCGSEEFEETRPCLICENNFSKDKLKSGLCRSCFEKMRHDRHFCMAIAGSEKVKININVFLASLFTDFEIEEILLNYIKQKGGDVDFSKFITSDPEWFEDALERRVEDENTKSKSR